MLGSGWVLRLDHRKWLREGVGSGGKKRKQSRHKNLYKKLQAGRGLNLFIR